MRDAARLRTHQRSGAPARPATPGSRSARRLGYDSETAFSRAFNRHVAIRADGDVDAEDVAEEKRLGGVAWKRAAPLQRAGAGVHQRARRAMQW